MPRATKEELELQKLRSAIEGRQAMIALLKDEIAGLLKAQELMAK